MCVYVAQGFVLGSFTLYNRSSPYLPVLYSERQLSLDLCFQYPPALVVLFVNSEIRRKSYSSAVAKNSSTRCDVTLE